MIDKGPIPDTRRSQRIMRCHSRSTARRPPQPSIQPLIAHLHHPPSTYSKLPAHYKDIVSNNNSHLPFPITMVNAADLFQSVMDGTYFDKIYANRKGQVPSANETRQMVGYSKHVQREYILTIDTGSCRAESNAFAKPPR